MILCVLCNEYVCMNVYKHLIIKIFKCVLVEQKKCDHQAEIIIWKHERSSLKSETGKMDDNFICVRMNEKDNMKSKRLLTVSELASYSDHKSDDGGEYVFFRLFSIHIGVVIFCFRFDCCCCHCYYCVVLDEVCIVL